MENEIGKFIVSGSSFELIPVFFNQDGTESLRYFQAAGQKAAKKRKAGNIALARGGWDRYQDGRFHFFEEGHTTDAEGENLGKQGGGVLGSFFKAEH